MPVSSRQLVSLLALVATIPLASAHGSLTKIDVAGKSYPAWIPNQDHYAAMNFANGAGAAAPDGKYSASAVVSIERTGRKNDILDNGYTDPSSAAIATGGTTEGVLYDATSPVKSIPMSAGDTVTFDMGTWPEGHSGPILNHMASCGGATCTGVDATTLDWFAIHHSGYDATAKIWPTDFLATTGAKHTITLPNDLPGGAYLLRFELIAMHSVPAQFYPWAAEIDLTSSGTSLPSSEYMGKFPDMYSAAANNMALDFSLYTGNDLMSFVLPGVPVYPGGSSKGNDPRPDGSAGPAPGPAPGNATVPPPSTGSEAAPAPTNAAGTEPAASASVTASAITSDILAVPSATSAAGETTEAAPAVPTMTDAAPTVPTTTDSATEDQDAPTDSQALPIETGSASEPAQPEPTQTEGAPSSVVPIPITTGTADESSATLEPSATEIAEPQPETTTTSPGEAQPDVPAPTASATASASGSVVEPSQMVPTDPVTEVASTTGQAAEPTGSASPPATGTGDEIQEVTEGDKTFYMWNGQRFNFKMDAYYHMCDKKRNDCLDAANSLPNAQVETARQTCETEAPACYSQSPTSMKKRRRNAKRHF